MTFIDKVIGHGLSRRLDCIQADMFDEIRQSVDSTVGLDHISWREINLNQTLQLVIDRSGNRAFFGPSICRNERYLRSLNRFILSMGAAALVVG